MLALFVFWNIFLTIITEAFCIFLGSDGMHTVCILPFWQEMQFQTIWGLSSIMNAPKSRTSSFTSVFHQARLRQVAQYYQMWIERQGCTSQRRSRESGELGVSFLNAKVKKWKWFLARPQDQAPNREGKTFSVQIFCSSMKWAEAKKV